MVSIRTVQFLDGLFILHINSHARTNGTTLKSSLMPESLHLAIHLPNSLIFYVQPHTL